jgi:hypothetical protein
MKSCISSEFRPFVAASPEEWIDDLSHFSRTLQNADSLENDVLTSAVSAVEETAPDMLLWVQNSKDEAAKRRVGLRVQNALESICSRIRSEDSEMPQMKIRVLNVADHLLECHKYILDQQIDRAAAPIGK